jgi:glycosyltransferase involved in cell wall biosynthesis
LRAFLPIDVTHKGLVEILSHEAAVSNYRNTYTLVQKIREFQPDIVYLFNLIGIGGLALMDVLNAAEVPWVLHLMDCLPDFLKAEAPLPVLSVFNAVSSGCYSQASIISMSQTLIDEISEKADVRFPQGVSLVPGWVNVSDLKIRREYHLDGITRFVNAGTVQPHKGIDLIIEASAQLYREGIRNFSVDIYGSGQIAHYSELCRQHGIDELIRFAGDLPQSRLIAKYHEYDCFLFPTWQREPFGFAPIEAAAAACVPIITAQCGAAERLIDGVHCLKITRRVEDVTTAMRLAISREVDLARIGAAAANLTRTDLAFQRCADRIEDILKSKAKDRNFEKIKDGKVILLSYMKHLLSLDLRFHRSLADSPSHDHWPGHGEEANQGQPVNF